MKKFQYKTQTNCHATPGLNWDQATLLSSSPELGNLWLIFRELKLKLELLDTNPNQT